MLNTLLSFFILANLPLATPVLPPPDFNQANLLAVAAVPVKKAGAVEPVVKAKAALLMDVETGTILYAKNIHEPLPMASLTKIMTAIIILESHRLNEVVKIGKNYADIDGNRLWLRQNEQVPLRDLLSAMLIQSANDAAMILAEYHSGSVEAFVAVMNQKAASLRLRNTRFENPVGFDAEGHHASAYDLALLTKYALRKAAFRQIVRQPEGELSNVDGNGKRQFQSTNELLDSYLRIEGVKTGTTDAAGACIINLARHPLGAHEVITVVLSSPNRFQESKSMIDWGFQNYAW